MKKKNMIRVAFLMGMSLLLLGFTQVDLKKDFVMFDKAFIPPLALTNAEKVQPSRKAMKILKENWTVFQSKYLDFIADDPEWKGDMAKIGQQIAEADRIVASGKNLMEAHEALEEIRLITLEMRKRNHIEYFMDPLTEFHAYMEEIFHTGQDNNPDDLTDEDIKGLAFTLSEAIKLWNEIGGIAFDQDLYGFDDHQVTAMKNLHKGEAQSLARVDEAIKAKDKPAIIKSARGVKPNYAKLYKMFGDFEKVMGKKQKKS